MILKIAYVLATLLFLIVLVEGTSLNGRCESDDHCGAVDSYCRNKTCVCRQNFAIHEDACIQVVDPRMSCVSDAECHPILGNRSICNDGSCACIPNHHLHNNSCIKNRGLHERCDEGYQCYWGQDMLDKMGCISGECSCKPGYRPHQHRRCESSANSSYIMSVATILMMAFLSKLF